MKRLALPGIMATLLGAAPATQHIVIRDAFVFDGSGAPARQMSVLISEGRIAALGTTVDAPAGARVIEGRGHTLLPGLHDLHTHLRSPAFDAPDDPGKAYAAYLARGITTVSDFSVYGEMFAPIRAMTVSGAVPAPRLKLAVRFSTTGGHGAERGWGDDFTLEMDTPRAARAAVARALTYRPDVLKVFTDGWRYGRSPSLSSMNLPTLTALVADAHAAGVPVITHTVTLAGAKIAAQAKVDALGHGIGDVAVDDELIALMKAGGTAYVPTLAVYEPGDQRRFTPSEIELLRPPERAREAARQSSADPLTARRWQIMTANLKALAKAGVPIAVGTDAGIGGIYHGTSTIRELKLLVAQGLTPAAALTAATSASAQVLRGASGRIAPGQPADLLLVAGRPDLRIDALNDVRRVFLAGREVALPPLRTLLASAAPSPLPRVRMAGPIDDGRSADGRTALGTLLVNSSDAGVDHSDLLHVRTPAAAGAARPIFMVARLGPAPRPFARLTVPLTQGAVQLADASGWTGIALRARGAGRYTVRIDSYGLQEPAYFTTSFAAGDTPAEIRLPFAAFASTDATARFDPASLRALIVELAGPPNGRVWMEMADLRFYK